MPTTEPERPSVNDPEHVRARYWREHIVGLTRAQLSDLTGFSADSIAYFEAGERRDGRPIEPATMKRYRRACAAVSANIRFNWLATRVSISGVLGDIELDPSASVDWDSGD